MQASDRVLARRYSLALYQCAADGKEERKIGEELARVAGKLSGKMAAYNHPRITAKDKKSRLRKELGSSCSNRTLRFLDLLIEKKRFTLLPHAAQVYASLCDEGEGIIHAKVRAARELSDAERKSLIKRLGARLDKKIVLNVKVEPDLLAGVVVRVGDWVFDASLQGELVRMRGRLAARN